MKEFLTKLIASKKEEIEATRKQVKESESADEVRALGDTLDKLKTELDELEAKVAELDKEEEPADEDPTDNAPADQEEARGFNPIASYSQNGGVKMEERKENKDVRSSMEYRTAFMNYVRTGAMTEVLQKRDNVTNAVADLGVLIPTTVVNEIIKETEKVYGQLYSKVKKTNLKGGVKYPLGAFSATFNRITETGAPSDRQKGGSITGYVEFGYKIGEIRLAQTLLMTVMGVEIFERELAKIIVEAYVEAMDKEIINGVAANNECEGILTEAKKADSKITNIVTFTADEIKDWDQWEKKLFAQIPLSMEGASPEFVVAKQTYVSNLCTLKDSAGQPAKKAGFDVTDREHKFNEYNVNRVEKDIFKDFDSCTNGEYFGMFWVPEKAYAVNSNLEFAVTKYYDNEKNEYVTKGIVINDGKVLDPKYIFLLKKSVPTA